MGNGNVGIIGNHMMDQPWQAAMFGNPHLKTIIPFWVIGAYDLMWRNGSMEERNRKHNGVYGPLDGMETVMIGKLHVEDI